MKREYETVIGFEVHIELNTRTKIFCGCPVKFGAEPNTLVCPVCSGMPGALPVLNKKVVDHALALGLALNCGINRKCTFDRKNYFYPDNPQNYQISQLYTPICFDGYADIDVNGEKKRIRIHEMHMEEDAGKLVHDETGNCSYVDFNRSGVPLLEIVSEPDIRSADEAVAYLEYIKMAAGYTGVSDCKMQEGSMRADLNISVREKGSTVLGTRTEIKNLSSFRAVTKAIKSEADRQIKILEQGGKVIQETRHWDEKREITYSSRSKEDAKDYRYFPEPDLPPVFISDEWIQNVKDSLPEMREAKIERYIREFAVSAYDAGLITSSVHLAELFEETVSLGADPKKAANWIIGETFRLMKENGDDPADIKFSAKNLRTLIELVDSGVINSTVAKDVFAKMYEDNTEPRGFVEENSLQTLGDADVLKDAALEVISECTKAADEYRSGKEKVLGFLVGQLMRKTKGKADPTLAAEVIRNLLK